MRKTIEESAWTIPNQRRELLPFVRNSLRANRNCEIDCKKKSKLLLKSNEEDIVANRISPPRRIIDLSNNHNLTLILLSSNAERFYDSLNIACVQNELPTKLHQRENDDTKRFDSENKSAALTMTKSTKTIHHYRHSPSTQQQQKRHSPTKIEKTSTISTSKNTNCENLSISRHTFSSSSSTPSSSSLSPSPPSPLSSSPTTSTLSLNMIFLRTRTNLTEAQYDELSRSQQYVNMAQSYHEHHCCRSHHHHQHNQQHHNIYHQHINNDTKMISPFKTSNYYYRNSKILSTSTFQTQRNNNNNCSPKENHRFQQFTKNIESQQQNNSRCDCDLSKISDLQNFRTISNFYQSLLLKLVSPTTATTTTTTTTIKQQKIFNDFNLINLLIILTILINIIPFVYGHNNITTNGSINNGEIVQNHQHQFYHQYASMARIETSEAAQRDAPGNDGIVNNIRREGGADGGGVSNNGRTNKRLSNFGGTAGFDDVGDHRLDRIDNNNDDDIEMDEMLRPSLRISRDPSTVAGNHGHHHLHHQSTDASAAIASIELPILRSGGCHSCQQREQVKADNLASIKRHILMRLKMDTLPNITAPVVPPEILEKFYKSQHQNTNTINNNNNNGAGIGGSSREHLQQYSSAPSASILNDGMQGDDPNAAYNYNDYGGSDGQLFAENPQGGGTGTGDEEDYEEDFFSVINSIYVFPTTSHMRHNRKTDILHFPLTNNGHSTVSEATLHIFVRGQNSIRENADPSAAGTDAVGGDSSATISQQDGGSNASAGSGKTTNSITSTTNTLNRHPEIVLKINRVLRHANSTHMQKGNEIRHMIPHSDDGMWITIDVTDMVIDWYNNGSQNHGVLIKTKETWMKQFVVIDESLTNKTYAPYIEVTTKDNRKRRSKRNTSLDCTESANEVRCCRYPLEVNFRQFNWEWIIAPQSFNAYFCNGECKLGFLPKYPHTHLMQLSTAPQPCCSPTKMSPITLLYFNNEHILVMSTIPNMAVDKCSCS